VVFSAFIALWWGGLTADLIHCRVHRIDVESIVLRLGVGQQSAVCRLRLCWVRHLRLECDLVCVVGRVFYCRQVVVLGLQDGEHVLRNYGAESVALSHSDRG